MRKKTLSVILMIPHLYSSEKSKLYMLFKSISKAKFKSRYPLDLKIIVHLDGIGDAGKKAAVEKSLNKKINNPVYCTWSVKNIGFTGGINKAIDFARHNFNFNWFTVLNDDLILNENFFNILFTGFQTKDIDVLSGKIKNIDGSLESFGLEYYKSGMALGNKKNNKPDYFCATCFCLSRRMIEREISQTGYVFNPLYFIYGEDLELSLRLYKNNKNMRILNKVVAIHEGSRSVGYLSYIQVYCSFRNWLYTILILWDINSIFANQGDIIIYQIKQFQFTLKKKYYFLYLRIIKDLFRNCFTLLSMRLQYKRVLKNFNKPLNLENLTEPSFLKIK